MNTLVQTQSPSTDCNSSRNQFNTKISNRLENHDEKNNPESKEPDVITIAQEDLQCFQHQVSGHGTAEKGLLKHKNGYILKPIQPPPMGTREADFYKLIFQEEGKNDESYKLLQEFVPKFHGVACVQNSSSGSTNNGALPQEYLLMEDILQGFKKPCVIDIKVGSQTWSPDATEKKINQEKSKYKGTKTPIGLCLTGMQYFDITKREECKMSKEFGKSLDPHTFKIAVKEFLNGNNSQCYQPLAQLVLEKLVKLEQVFSIQTAFKLYGSSVLIAYDADQFIEIDQSNVTPKSLNKDTSLPLRLFMIDFAHFHTEIADGNVDENYLFGLRNLIKIMGDIVDNCEPGANQVNAYLDFKK